MTDLVLPRRPLGRTGLTVPAIGYGSVPIGRPGHSLEEARRLLDGLLHRGIDLIDTAAAYGRAEEVLGRLLAGRREQVVLVTKTGAVEGYRPAWSAREIAATVDASLRKLATDRVDVLLLHSCDLATLRRGEAVEALLAAQRAGKARFVGYSGDNEALEHALGSGLFDVVEASYSLLDQANGDRLRRAAEAGVGVLVKRPIANAVPGRAAPPPSDYAAEYWPRWQAMALAPQDVDGLDWLEVAIRFAAHAPGATTALVGSGRLEHVLALADAAARGPLPSHVQERIRARFRAVGGDWPGLT